MRNPIVYLLAIFSVIYLPACETGEIECIRASSTVVQETRNLKDFQGVVFNTSGDLIITQGNDFSFSIEGPDNVVALTNTTVENGLLQVGTQNCFNGSYDVTVRVTAPEFRLINLSGIGSVTSQGTITGDVISLELFGIGEVDADFEVDSLYTTVSGQFSNISLGGSAGLHQLSSNGKFTLNAFSLDTDKTVINQAGLGDSYVTVNDKLTVIISGDGNVYYQGQPTIESEITGTGQIIDAN